MPAKTAKPNPKRRVVTDANVKRAIQIRTKGGSWQDVIDATGFNGSILRKHMAKAGYNPKPAPKTPAKKPATATRKAPVKK